MRLQLPNTTRFSTRRNAPRKGAALVEAAIVIPMFFMVILGIVEFGRGMMVAQLVTNAAREAARRAVLDGSDNTTIEQYIQDKLSASVGAASSDITVGITITPDPNNNTTGHQLVNAQPYDLVTVTVSVPYNKVSYLAGRYLSGRTLRAETTMRHE
ncbi:TadE family protein [Fuerstiella marisgermanici]|uniref:Flp pilus assembly protein n=1 Tax=Fuerstiella marisgermanici TaxID=1891926 RepID=A0A1P8WN46_9PLAN|nr:TadE/TadG family type IV pilus assembly protein [Fuerstiella marisgermanici]APZ95492.1 Flp pilus assembly protein [Fuerstiella marisgermanici]